MLRAVIVTLTYLIEVKLTAKGMKLYLVERLLCNLPFVEAELPSHHVVRIDDI